MLETGNRIELARQFATALDACDYRAAAEFLASDCRYHVSRDDVRIGPPAILASYRESDAKARRNFDSVRYLSEVMSDDSGRVRMTFSDELRIGGASHTYRCSQIVRFGENAKIHEIELLEVPSERARLKDFCKSHGISPD